LANLANNIEYVYSKKSSTKDRRRIRPPMKQRKKLQRKRKRKKPKQKTKKMTHRQMKRLKNPSLLAVGSMKSDFAKAHPNVELGSLCLEGSPLYGLSILGGK